jgi:hypothetical protein
MPSSTPSIAPAASEPRLRRHRRVRAVASDVVPAMPGGESLEIVSLLAEALERIALTTTDPEARSIAELAMHAFHGR